MFVRVLVQFLDHHARAILVLLTLFFLSVETYYAVNRPLSHDEFSGAWSVAQLATRTPYVDFQPYKPVLGYYFQLPLLRLGADTWHGFVAVRLGMVYLTGSVLFLGALWLQRIFRPGAVSLAFALMVVMTSLLEWAIEVRLDMMTALFGFISLLLLLNRRVALAGIVAGLSFLISQKGSVYGLAGAMALLGCLMIQRDRRWGWDLLAYSACVVLPISLYVLYWSSIASFPSVWRPTFAEPTQLRALTTPGPVPMWYSSAWQRTLTNNPFFYVCALWALGGLIALGQRQKPRETMLLFYGGVVIAIMLSVQTPALYSFVLIVPTLFVLQANLFSNEFERRNTLLCQRVFWLSYGLLGLILPLSDILFVAQDDNGPQRLTLKLTEALLGPEDRFFAGFQLLYRREANAQAMSMTDGHSSPPTQALTPTQVAEILDRLEREPIRLVIYTFKVHAFEFEKREVGNLDARLNLAEAPFAIRRHFYRNYAPLWSNVWIYAPQVKPSDSAVELLFTDVYSIETERPTPVLIDGQTYAPRATVELRRGHHAIATASRLRLKLRAAKADHLLNPAYRFATWFFWPAQGLIPYPADTGIWVDS